MNDERQAEEQVTEPGEKSEEQQTRPAPAASEQKATSGTGNSETVEESKDVKEGKPFAILSYALSFIGIPFFLLPLIIRNNDFSLFHAKQCLMIWVVGMIGGAISGILMLVCIGFVLAIVVGIFALVLNIIGLVKAVNGERKPLPWVGGYAEEWFKGITLVK
ncbi:MAG: DUF4870 domain-containing protein [Verrucomicrobiota bacterium]